MYIKLIKELEVPTSLIELEKSYLNYIEFNEIRLKLE